MSGKMVEFKSNGGMCEGYLAVPESGGGPGVIVLQEWWGLVDHIKDVCDRFAAAGYVALAPDLYHGESSTSPDDAGKLMMAINIAETEKDMAGAITHLLSLDETTSSNVGTVGFCMGGQLSLYAACANPTVGACVMFYGIHPEVHPDIPALQAPFMGFFAENDPMVTPDAAHALESALKDAGKSADVTVYEGADHAFFNDTREDVYHEAHAKDCWNRMLAFYGANVK
ncbi:MAG: dienelactone hydrolase family protein [Candidatus Hydrogenedentota bacterium]